MRYPKRLYHYTTFESFVKIWYSKRLLFGNIKNVNDLLEQSKEASLLGFGLSFEDDKEDLKRVHECLSLYRQISLSMDIDEERNGAMSLMMWGHYAEKGRGVCIELDTSKLDLVDYNAEPIEYVHAIPPTPLFLPVLHTKEEAKAFIEKHLHEYFFIKSDDWEKEHEFRIITNEENKKGIDISKAITKIYVAGFDPSKYDSEGAMPNANLVVRLVNGEVPVFNFGYRGFLGYEKVPRTSDAVEIQKIYNKWVKNEDTEQDNDLDNLHRLLDGLRGDNN